MPLLGCVSEHYAPAPAIDDAPAAANEPPAAGPADAAGTTSATRTDGRAAASDVDEATVESGIIAVAPFHIVGRIDTRDPAGPRFGWPGAEIRARFTGPGLSLELADTGASWYDVVIDGAAPTQLVVSGARKPYAIGGSLPGGVHDVVLTKRTETFLGVTQLFAVTPLPGGALVPTPIPAARRIELIGDSITCGYGVLGSDHACPFTAETEAEPLAWGALAARQLGALRALTAVSGIGVLRNYGGETENTMPERYGRSIADDPTSAWDHSFVPDLIVVNLGTNDFAGGKGDPGPAFQTAYAAFLATLRATHPNATIVCATSPMLSEPNRTTLRTYVEGAIAQRAAAGDMKLTLLDIEEHTDADGYGCGYHPSVATQAKMAARLVAHVKPLMGW